MHKNFFHKKTSLLKKVIPLSIMLMLGCTLMSFTIYTPLSKQLSTNPKDGEKDSVKGFRNLLSSNINSNNTTVLFEINARIVPFVTDYLKKQSGNLEKMRSWGQPYFMIYEHVLSSNGLPVELKYLSVVESNLQPGAVSYAGAVGPWQLMPDEAKRFGLKVIPGYDERTNVLKSTEAATKLLKELYSEYKDWLLVIAAYNCGKGGVNRAIVKSGSRNFYDLQMYLPEETRNHVKKYIATHYFFEGGGGWTTITAKETEEKKETLAYLLNRSDTTTNANTISFEITGKYNSLVAANILMMSIGQFNAFNPYFDKTLSEGKPYTVKLPQDKMDIFKTRRQQILYESVQLLLNGTSALPISTVTAVK